MCTVRFSIIIPVYNVAPYLHECIDSVLAQTLDSWEAILVDDGSADGSGGMLDEYIKEDNRLRVVHQKNLGVAAARNVGLEIAKGDWIVFLDADDHLSPFTLEILNKAICLHPDVDLVQYRYQWYQDGVETFKGTEDVSNVTFEFVDVSAYISYTIHKLGFCEVAYSRRVVGGERFPPMVIGEDRLFYLRVLERARKMVVTNAVLYGYRSRAGSATTGGMTASKLSDDLVYMLETLRLLDASTKRHDESLNRVLALELTENLAKLFWQMSKDDRRKTLPHWTRALRIGAHVRWLPLGIRLLMLASGYGNTMFACWLFCYVPYRVKSSWIRSFVPRRFIHA